MGIIIRIGSVQKIEFSTVSYMEHNWGFGSEALEQIIKTVH